MKGTTKSLGRKNALDKFYTKYDIAARLIKNFNFSNYDLIIEPSAGNGAFSKQIQNCLALDIAPQDDSIIQQDFFTFSPSSKGKILTIGNPPFGEQAKLAIDFFNYAAKFSTTIAFILPKSFKKISIQNRLDLNFHLVKEEELPTDSFLLEGEDYSVPCVFQIWERKNEKRVKIKMPTTSDYFDFTKDKEKADFRIQRVGGKAGVAFNDKEGAISSNYYLINKSQFSTEELVKILNTVVYYSLEDTVGPKSLPKGELISESNIILQEKSP